MFLLAPPSAERIRRFLADQRDMPFSYAGVGASRGTPPRGYNVDHHRVRLGAGREAFERATAALRRWGMFDLGWVRLCWPDTPIAAGATVGVVIRLFGLWSLNSARIVYILDDAGPPIWRYGFAYGTLPGHAERGEERFSVEWRHDDDSVWYDLYAFSRPNHALARIGYPLTRMLQKRFARDSQAAMVRAVNLR
jgi:uncharacterized protein (UPF0548 family)